MLLPPSVAIANLCCLKTAPPIQKTVPGSGARLQRLPLLQKITPALDLGLGLAFESKLISSPKLQAVFSCLCALAIRRRFNFRSTGD